PDLRRHACRPRCLLRSTSDKEPCPMAQAAPRRIGVEIVDGITVVNFVDTQLVPEEVIQEVGEQLFSLVEGQGSPRLLLNFRNVRAMATSMLGKLVALKRKVEVSNGRLKLCGFRPDLWEIFKITKLERVFENYDEEQAALDAF